MRHLTMLGVAVLLMLPASAGAQSLAEIAKKERERRADNAESAEVVDDTRLQEFERESSSSSEPRPATESKAESAAVDASDEATSSDAIKSEAELRDEITACYERLAEAREELQLEEKRQRVPVLVAKETMRGGTWVSDGRGGEYLWGGEPETLYYEKGMVSCLAATRNRARYPEEARTCDEIQDRVYALRAEIAAGCDVPN